MRWKKLAPVVLSLCCVTASAQEAREREVYITLGSEALDSLRTSFRASGETVPTLVREANGVSVLKLREGQLGDVSRLMHDQYNRCAGFMTHETQEAALAALEPAQPSLTQTLVSYTLDNAAVVNTLFSGLQEASLRSTITSLSSYTNRYYNGSTSAVQASNWLRDTWAAYAANANRDDVTVALYTHSSWSQPSVIATITGTVTPNEVVVIGGHLDSININVGSSSRPTATAPGADDDASGVATLSEVFRVAMAKGYKPARTVKFMAYAAEEVGLLGSQAIAQAHKASPSTLGTVVGVLQLDMTNYRGSTVEVTLVTDNTNAAQNAFLGNLIDTYTGYTRSNITCGYGCSDHASWNAQGYPASIPFEALMNQDNPYIHTANDTLANSTGGNATNALKFARIAAAYLAELGKGTIPGLPTDTTDPTVSLSSPASGATVTGTVSIAATATDNVGVSKVEFLVDGALKGTSFASPYSFAWDSRTVANGSHTVAAKASDSAGNSATTTARTVTVSNVSTSGTYDSTLKTVRCSAVAATCDSGTAFTGRGTRGPELSYPNTLRGTCADGSGGTFHSDESMDALKVSTVDGTPFAPGKQVKVEATVWAYANPASDRLELFYTANATATTPVWTQIGTSLTPTAAGAVTLSATYTLPSGTNQAVRAQFRYGSSSTTSPCVSNEYNDRDDLVFAVGQ
ncbi:M20/M25/M40 family metallo-hydrolase [Corallococcus llansteffanensis]|uniref:M20/M25/M40 family metallo-hydrolase n=1 Tax=Corallococcus llansteffanensis TaxID=2316731 RepID=A0A3A8NHS6_9BACT|nr:M20/M25/M40 family metallo-hydrolase [Corallococcus llansteffanensis]RKH43946.1 M20/M25/M40 family metallo-hydrolase [Corallococcus llansteffanensis]